LDISGSHDDRSIMIITAIRASIPTLSVKFVLWICSFLISVSLTILPWKEIVVAYFQVLQTNKQTPWPLVRERTIPTDRPPLVDEI
jgi:hypothetical protein